MSELADIAAERALLAGLCQYGQDANIDTSDIITIDTLTLDSNQIIYKCITHTLKTSEKTDIASIIAAASELGFYDKIKEKSEIEYIRSLFNFPIHKENVRSHAKKLAKLQIARRLQIELKKVFTSINNVTGSESVAEILGLAQRPIMDFGNNLGEDENVTSIVGGDLAEYLLHLKENPNKPMGISSGFTRYDTAIGGGFRRKTISLIGARMKALRYGSKVYQKQGPINIENIKVGDLICHPFNGYAKVLDVHDHYNIQIYRMYFRDGDYIDCCGDHLWEVYKRYPYKSLKNKKPEIKPTKDLIEDLILRQKKGQNEYKWDIRLPNSAKFAHANVILDPYILGLLLGDGSLSNSICFHNNQEDSELINYIKANLPNNDIKIDHISGNCISYRINGLQDIIRQLGLFKHGAYSKFIPNCYKYNSEKIRIEIIRGLMDTDGCCSKDGNNIRCIYSTVSKQLALDVKEIVQSLGGLCSITLHKGSYKNAPHYSYSCEIRTPNINPFKLLRKANKYTSRKLGELKRTITKIVPLCYDNARCLTLDINDGLFMTDNFVVTHNSGKSIFAENVAMHVAGRLGIPVLMLDTEMAIRDHQHRLLAYNTKIPLDIIEGSKFWGNPILEEKINRAVSKIEALPYTYACVAGKSFPEILSITHRWLCKEVGETNGVRNDCLVIYDYFKLMTSEDLNKNMQEFQVLGFQISNMHNFCVKYDFPVLSYVQLNRDGITGESTDVVSQSDRLLWLCNNFSIFKSKTTEEIVDDGEEWGNKKLIPLVCRNGAGVNEGNYINMYMQGQYAMLEELRLKSEAAQQAKEGSGFEVEDDEE